MKPSLERTAFVLAVVANEVDRATDIWPPFYSPHDGWAIIKEEVDELWDLVRANSGRGEEAEQEATQIAAMAIRYLLDLTTIGEDFA